MRLSGFENLSEKESDFSEALKRVTKKLLFLRQETAPKIYLLKRVDFEIKRVEGKIEKQEKKIAEFEELISAPEPAISTAGSERKQYDLARFNAPVKSYHSKQLLKKLKLWSEGLEVEKKILYLNSMCDQHRMFDEYRMPFSPIHLRFSTMKFAALLQKKKELALHAKDEGHAIFGIILQSPRSRKFPKYSHHAPITTISLYDLSIILENLNKLDKNKAEEFGKLLDDVTKKYYKPGYDLDEWDVASHPYTNSPGGLNKYITLVSDIRKKSEGLNKN